MPRNSPTQSHSRRSPRAFLTAPHSRGFAFSADVVLALILVSAVALFIAIPNQKTSFLEERRVADQYVDDIFLAMDHSGYVSHEIDVNGFASNTLQNIYSHIRTLLPAQYDLYVQLKSYPVDINSCRSSQNFASCFPDINTSTLAFGTTLPTTAPFVHGRRVFIKQQAPSACTGGLSPRGGGPFDLLNGFPASFQSAPDINVQFDVNVIPSGPLTCDQNITVNLQVTTASGTRKAVDMMLVFDRSGSMSWGGQLNGTAPVGVAVDTNYAYLADGSSGLRDINTANPGLPNLLGTYNSPGTAEDVDVNGNYAYLADNTSGLRIVDITNKAAPASVSQSKVGGTADGVWSQGNVTYVNSFGTTQDVLTTASGSPSQIFYVGGGNVLDVETTTSSVNQTVLIGNSSSASSAGQSFTANASSLSAFSVRLRKFGSPGDITAHLRSSISGTDINSWTILASSVSTTSGGVYVDVNFSDMTITSGSTYYIVLTTAANSSSNYYEWEARNGNPYAGGSAYQNTTAQSSDAFLRTWYAASSAAQSFAPAVDFISGLGVRLRKVGSPGNITARLRSSISGSDLNTLSISSASVSTSSGGAYIDVNFSGVIPLTSGSTYYLVLTTSSANSWTNYYEWEGVTGNPYASGQGYQNTVASASDAYLRTYFKTGLIAVDTSVKASPRIIGAADLNDAYHVSVNGNYAYAANGTRGFRIFNVSNPGNITLAGNCYSQSGCNISAGTATDVWVNNNYAYVSDGNSGLRIVNVSTPSAPALVSTYNTPGNAYTTRLKDTNAIIADGTSLLVIDVSNPSTPTLAATYATPYDYADVDVRGNWAYIAVDSGIPGLMTIDLTTGPKVDQAKRASTTFVDFNGWNSQNDQMGLVSFSSTPTLDQILTKNYALVKSAVSTLVANGGTAIGDAINSATTHFSMVQADVSNSGSQNQALYIGQTASNLTGGQSFQPVMPYLTRVDAYVRKVGSPASGLTLELRSSISGTAIASVTVPASSISTSYTLTTFTFPSSILVSSGTTYYLVATTGSTNASNYYQWGATSTNPYSGGQAYQNSNAQATWDARFISYGGYSNPTSLKFQVLMSDGQTNTGSSSATAAITAKNNNIVIYTIGFGSDADMTELCNISSITGGQCYAASDQNTLLAMYQLIAQNIQTLAQDANIVAGFSTGTVIVNDGNASINGNNIIFDVNTLAPQPWTASYTFNIPCTAPLACSSTLISIPGTSTKFQYVDINGNPQSIDWNDFVTTAFNYRDLNVDILSGNILGVNNVDLTLKVSSLGTLDTNAAVVKFYRGNPSPANLVSSAAVPSLCGAQRAGCVSSNYSFTQNIPAEGDLFAVVNDNNAIPECTYNDQDYINCYTNPQTQFFTLDYWAWIRG